MMCRACNNSGKVNLGPPYFIKSYCDCAQGQDLLQRHMTQGMEFTSQAELDDEVYRNRPRAHLDWWSDGDL